MNKNYLFRKNVLKKIKIDIIQLIQLWHNDIFELKWLSIHELNNKVKRIENEVRNWSFNPMFSPTSAIKSVLIFIATSNVFEATNSVYFQSCQ